MAEDLGAEIVRVWDRDVARALVRVAHDKNVDSLVLGHSRHGWLHRLLRGSVTERLLRIARDIDLHIVADRRGR